MTMFKILMTLTLLILASCGDKSLRDHLVSCESDKVEFQLERDNLAYQLLLARQESMDIPYLKRKSKIEGCKEFKGFLIDQKEKLSEESWSFCESYTGFKL